MPLLNQINREQEIVKHTSLTVEDKVQREYKADSEHPVCMHMRISRP